MNLLSTAEIEAIKRNSALMDEKERFIPENLDILFKNGIYDLLLPETVNGKNFNFTKMSEVLLEVSSHCHYTGLILSMHYHTVGSLRHLTKLDDFFINVTKEKALFASINDPKVLADSNREEVKKAIGITYSRKGSQLIINGYKRYVSGAPLIRYLPVYAYNEDLNTNFPVSILLIDMKHQGISIEKNWNSNSMVPTETFSVRFNNVNLGDEYLVSTEGRGIEESKHFLYWFRIALCSVYLGIAKAAYNHIQNYILSKEKLITDKSITNVFSIIKIKYEVAKSQLFRTTTLADNHYISNQSTQELDNQTLILKYIITEAVNEIIEECLKIEGLSSLNKGELIERLSRDARAAFFHPPKQHEIIEELSKKELGIIPIRRIQKSSY